MKPVQTHELRKRALKGGVSRRDAWILAIIGYWSQIKGGIEIGPGPNWKWRNYSDFKDDTGYGVKTVQRAVADLKVQCLIEVMRIWNPVKGGQNVNAFRLTTGGYEILELPCPPSAQAVLDDTVAKSHSPASNGSPRYGHSGSFKITNLSIKNKGASILLISEEEKKEILSAPSAKAASEVLKLLGKDPDAMIMDVDLVGKLLGFTDA